MLAQDFRQLCYCIVVASSPKHPKESNIQKKDKLKQPQENFLFLPKFKFRLWIPRTKGLVLLRSGCVQKGVAQWQKTNEHT